jgi:hypothetical protein
MPNAVPYPREVLKANSYVHMTYTDREGIAVGYIVKLSFFVLPCGSHSHQIKERKDVAQWKPSLGSLNTIAMSQMTGSIRLWPVTVQGNCQ